MDLVLIPMLLARPHVLAWPLLAVWIWLMLRAREQDRAPPLRGRAADAFWANLHGSFVFGLAIAAAFGLEALIVLRRIASALSGNGCSSASPAPSRVCINANGLDGAFYPLRVTDLEMLPLIDEWKPSSRERHALLLRRCWRSSLVLIAWKRPRLHSVRWLLLAALLGARAASGAAPGDVRDRRRNDPSARFRARAAALRAGASRKRRWSIAGGRGSAAARGAHVHAADAARKSRPIRGS